MHTHSSCETNFFFLVERATVTFWIILICVCHYNLYDFDKISCNFYYWAAFLSLFHVNIK